MRKRSVLLLLALLMVGISIMAYPAVRDYLYRRNASYAIYQSMESMDDVAADDSLQQAEAYNISLQSNETSPSYWEALDLGNGLMGSLEIPEINVYLPIYHGTDSQTLTMGVGHLEGSALPIGGMGNHTVLTGHTGLPSAELLTDLTELSIGDVFYIHVLHDTLCYQVADIQIILPEASGILQTEPDKDLCTLVTCTPYGINSHRLLVQGERIEQVNVIAKSQAQPQSIQIPISLAIALIALLCLLGYFLFVLFKRR